MTTRRLRGITRVEVVVVATVGMLILAMVVPACKRVRTDASRQTCLAHLGQIGRAMLLYANDHGGKLPRPGGPTSFWRPTIVRWDAPTRQEAFGIYGSRDGGYASISSAFYLLVKYAQLQPGDCICPGDVGSTEFRLSDLPGLAEDFKLTDAWDFGPEASLHCSYAYSVPFWGLTTARDPRTPVAADRNPWLCNMETVVERRRLFIPDLAEYKGGSPETARHGNSPSHDQDGQNVLFLDGHVSFQERSHCGIGGDNIYTVSSNGGDGSPGGYAPTFLFYEPANSKDSLLINDPPVTRSEVTHEVKPVDSKDLKETAVVATLDCPLPEHKNAIWCSTFQMAWDKFKNDLVGEPIRMRGAEDLVSRLNQGAFPTGDIEAKSYYANAGFVKDGIIGQIQKDMASRFPSEDVPTFDSRYTELPEVALTYAYLNVDVGFVHPYYVNDRPFVFNASEGRKTNVTSFSTSAPSVNNTMVRGQVDILHYEFGDTPDGDEFIVDLCTHTKPYQIILARMPRGGTLGETQRTVQERMTKFKDDPDYAVLSKLRPIDSLTVPDVLYRLTHHFEQLLEKPFGNGRWEDFYLFEALQRIDFSLSRTGVVLKSVAIGGGTASRSPQQLAKPRHLRYDRPFLICVKKREPDAAPFFLMWVDNAELMQPATTGQ